LPDFSPDGKSIVLFSNFDSRNPDVEGMGIYLIDAESGAARHLGMPPQSKLSPTELFGSVYWAADRSTLYLFMVHPTVESYRVRLDGHFEPVEGDYKRYAMKAEFRLNGQLVALFDPPNLQSRRGWSAQASSDGKFKADIDMVTHELRVIDSGGNPRHVATGGYNQCEGITIDIKGWVGHFLVYSVGNEHFLFDAERGRSRRLFADWYPGDDYFWPTAAGN